MHLIIEVREAIAEIYKTFEEAFHREDADGISLMYTEDAELFALQASIIKGGKPSLMRGGAL